jgi:signal transduction histidine kinase
VNAIKFTPAPGVIEVKACGQAGAAVLEISDQGAGIPGNDLHRVFDRFYKGGNSVQAELGHGVGLALAKWIIDEHKGRIELISPGRLADGNGRPGTTVMLRLDLAEDSTNASG